MSVFVLVLLQESFVYDQVVCLGKEDAELLYERWCDTHDIDKRTNMSGDESMQIIYFQAEVVV